MRSSGILMHITSLPGPYGVGTMGKSAFEFVDFLKKSGQGHWQLLPLTPTGYGDSPYQSCSAYAGNHYLIDLDLLVEEGLLEKAQLDAICWGVREDKTDFGMLYNNRLKVLSMAYERFEGSDDFDSFCAGAADWLPDFALFMAIKEQKNGAPWYQWEDSLKRREPEAIWQARQSLKDRVRFYSFVQYLFFKQWNALQAYAHKNEIRIIGDVPIYVPYDSVEVWCSPELFQLDEAMTPTAVAGCPPDAFSEDGQLWGNPLYRWEVHAADGYNWWIRRLKAAARLYDVIRIDHFRGFEAYWSVPFGAQTAVCGHWEKGPGKPFFDAVKRSLPNLNMIAEDLGFLTDEVFALRDGCQIPGMKVMQFAFDGDESNLYLPDKYTENCIAYTGTHDNDTLRGFIESAPVYKLDFARRYLAPQDGESLGDAFLRAVWASRADVAIAPMQDLLNLPTTARMNTPSTVNDKNWRWRMADDSITPELSERLLKLNKNHLRI